MSHKGFAQDRAMVKQAFEETLDMFGERTKRTIIVTLECTGEYDRSSENISFEKITAGLQRFIGAEAAELIIEKMLIRLEELTLTTKSKRFKLC